MEIERVSVHGGHSGQFCSHASNTLEEIVLEYIEQGFSWVGITEHIPPLGDAFLYPEEMSAGLTVKSMRQRFDQYMRECRRLKNEYEDRITVFVAMELEAFSGYAEHVEELQAAYAPEYLVGSVHHVADIPIDYSPEHYRRAVIHAGSVEELYCSYFDLQFEMLQRFTPSVVGHFDLIRIFDEDYRMRLALPEVEKRIERNLAFVKAHNLILDFNLRSLLKGAEEPYVSEPVLNMAREMGIDVVPGDDSHGVADIGINMEMAVSLLSQKGFSTDWKKPVR